MRGPAVIACFLVVIGAITGTAVAGAGAPAPAAQADCSFPASATDGTGREVTVEEEPERVVVLAPSTAQIMWEIGAESKVVGMPVGPYTAYLNGSSDRTNVWNADGSVDQEAVVRLDPDLVVTADLTPNGTVRDLRSAGLTVYRTPFDRSLATVPRKVATVGRFVGACEGATATADEFNASLAEIRETAPDRSPRVLYYFFNFTAGSGTFVGEAIETAGGDNVAATAGIEGFVPLNDEVVATRDPQWIVVPEGATVPDREPFTSTAAVRANRTLVVDDNYISQPAPRVVIPMRRMAEAFADTRTLTATATEAGGTRTEDATPPGTPTPSPTTETPTDRPGGGTTATTTGQPGFGLAAALVALLALAALAARRP